MTGLLALDIDGTVTTAPRHLPESVISFLSALAEEGWSIAFLTGRTYHQCYQALEALPFPFFLAVQNGAIILSMPQREVIFKHYLSKDVLLAMSKICNGRSTDVVVYGGYEFEDSCYYRPTVFDPVILEYLRRRCVGYNETWTSLGSFQEMPLAQFPSTKTFGAIEPLLPIGKAFERDLGLQAPINKDPFEEGYYVLQTTEAIVNKGRAVEDLRSRLIGDGIVIAAGDDLNDLTLLQAGDIKVAMANAPRQLLDVADIIAPPATENGIIIGLTQALKRLRR